VIVNSQEQKGPLKMEAMCEFCQVPMKGTTDLYYAVHKRSQLLVVPQLPQNFFIMHHIAPLGVDGWHVMVLPKSHFRSMASMDDITEGKKAVDIVLQKFQERFSNSYRIFVFEHGAGAISGVEYDCGISAIDHGHFHVLALPLDASIETIRQAAVSRLIIRNWRKEIQDIQPEKKIFPQLPPELKGHPYLYCGMLTEQSVTSYLFPQLFAQEESESQLFSHIVGEIVYGCDHKDHFYWNWRDLTFYMQNGISPKGPIAQRVMDIKANVHLFHEQWNQLV
jgi:hypothetical protein